MTKPITVWMTPPGPNPWKVDYLDWKPATRKYCTDGPLRSSSSSKNSKSPTRFNPSKFDDIKNPPFVNINPNGRAPAIVDPNPNLTLWESGAIIQYLIEVYDPEKKLTYTTLHERHLLNQYLHFQMSGQGPYFGQAAWFNVFHPEKLPTVIDRYANEVRRVLRVLNTVLKGKTWLVGDKPTVADLAFVPWNGLVNFLLPGEDYWTPYPHVEAWQRRMEERASWKKCLALRAPLMDEQGLQPNGMPKGLSNAKEYDEVIARNAEEQKKQ
ncbi:glutathione transferase [Aspergillus saccharolyticus JOP 1030-1]|uniref:glutathione transferase n=1 Tax=Aspergillus saccharolyticus JOP 1030-1 TaxID=1450539 RepID=A0A318Z651_9EURO|nr:glutathione transferase [Aspergillus saccharolyticus JOP 1030-1]PYH42539.1 glutathione transferase [Aspergillus saccharolyticus JOP 1030-1]